MFHKFRWSILSAAVILALLVSAFPLGAVMAEGEEPVPTETPATEELPATQEEAPPPVEVAMTVEEVVAQVPEDVVVVPVDPAGVALPMVEEAVAKSYVTGDPVYCPMNIPFGESCFHYDTIDEAINQSMTTDFGTVYVEVNYTDSNPAPIMIDGSFGPGLAWQFYLIGGVDISTGEIVGRTKLTRQIVVNNVPNFNMENFSVTLPEIVQLNPEEEGEAAPAAFSAETTGNISISDSDFNNNPGSGLSIDTNGNVSLYNVQANNNGAGNSISNIYGDLFITHSKFNGNQGTGLVASTNRNIFAMCNQAKNNAGVDTQFPEIGGGGMYLKSLGSTGLNGEPIYGNITVWCNIISGNSSYGLVVETPETIYTATNNIYGNGLIDFVPISPYEVVEQSAPCSEFCPSCNGEGSGVGEEKPAEGNTQVVIVKVGDGSGSAEIKAGYSTVFKLYEEKEDKERLVQLTALTSGSAPDGSSAVYTPLDGSKLPAPLPEGTSLIPWGFNLAITNPDGSAVESLIGYMLVRFYLPEGFVLPGGMRLVIQHFNPATSSWEPMSTAVGGGTAFTYASKPGTYVLTMVPIK